MPCSVIDSISTGDTQPVGLTPCPDSRALKFLAISSYADIFAFFDFRGRYYLRPEIL